MGHHSMHRTLALLPLLVALAACAETNGPKKGLLGLPALPAASVSGVRAAIVSEALADGEVVLAVRLDARDVAVAAYQGRFTFDPKALELIAVEPSTADGFVAVNDQGRDAGELRFASFAPSEYGRRQVPLRLRFRVLTALEGADVAVALDVVGTEQGEQVAKSLVATLPGLYRETAAQRAK